MMIEMDKNVVLDFDSRIADNLFEFKNTGRWIKITLLNQFEYLLCVLEAAAERELK